MAPTHLPGPARVRTGGAQWPEQLETRIPGPSDPRSRASCRFRWTSVYPWGSEGGHLAGSPLLRHARGGGGGGPVLTSQIVFPHSVRLPECPAVPAAAASTTATATTAASPGPPSLLHHLPAALARRLGRHGSGPPPRQLPLSGRRGSRSATSPSAAAAAGAARGSLGLVVSAGRPVGPARSPLGRLIGNGTARVFLGSPLALAGGMETVLTWGESEDSF